MSAVSLTLPLTFAMHWRHAGLALLLSVAWVLVWYRETAASMVLIWQRSDTFAHGFLVPPIVAWLIWRQRRAIARVVPQPSIALLPVLACVALVWLLGELAAANTLTQTALVGLLVLSVPVVVGWSVARYMVFPLGFLFFAVPMGEFLLPQLMEWTANFTVFALRISGVPVYREGLNFVIPSGPWSVVEACSGVRYLIASLTVGTLFAYLNYQSTRRRLLFVAASIVVPVVANWVRAYMIVMLGHLSNNRLATGVDHLLYGWLFFGVVIVLMFLVGARWAQPEHNESVGMPELSAAPGGGAATAPVAAIWLATLGMALITACAQLALWTMERNAGGDASASVMERGGALSRVLPAPTALGPGWSVSAWDAGSGLPHFKPAYQNPSLSMHAAYASAGKSVGLYLGIYRQQGRGHALVSSDNVLVQSKDAHWAVVARSSKSVLAGGQPIMVHGSQLRRADLNDSLARGALRVWQVNWVNGSLTHSDHLAKAIGAFYRLIGRSDDAAVIVIYTPEGIAGQGDAALASFLADNYAAINALLMRNVHTGEGRSNTSSGAHPVNAREVLL
ncbi:MAG: exosortase A [Rhodoferax sp.]|nr:exosortase A [Rhodoferax sp.]